MSVVYYLSCLVLYSLRRMSCLLVIFLRTSPFSPSGNEQLRIAPGQGPLPAGSGRGAGAASFAPRLLALCSQLSASSAAHAAHGVESRGRLPCAALLSKDERQPPLGSRAAAPGCTAHFASSSRSRQRRVRSWRCAAGRTSSAPARKPVWLTALREAGN